MNVRDQEYCPLTRMTTSSARWSTNSEPSPTATRAKISCISFLFSSALMIDLRVQLHVQYCKSYAGLRFS